jgi:sec-independent protein translocase protein TatA
LRSVAVAGDVPGRGAMPRVGFGELLVIGFVLLVVFSASRMSALGNALGKFVYSFRKASRGQGFVDVKPTRTLRERNEQDPERAAPRKD